MQNLDFSVRYGKRWADKKWKAQIHQATGGICCHCFQAKSTEIHHARYSTDGTEAGAIRDKERPGIDVFPLCEDCHGIAHSRGNWIRDKENPIWGHRNTDEFTQTLMRGWVMSNGRYGQNQQRQPNFTMPKQGVGRRQKSLALKITLALLYIGAVSAIGYFGYMNTKPYVEFVRLFLAEDGLASPVIQLFAKLPLIGGIIGFFSGTVTGLLGLLLWLMIQMIEILPLVLKRNRSLMRSYIQDAQSDCFEVYEHDDPFLAKLKEAYNMIPTKTVRQIRKLSLLVYALDFCICVWIYPPVSGGFDSFMLILGTGQLSQLNIFNCILLLSSLFAIEAILIVLFVVGDLWRRINQIKATGADR
jgi:hypothetical protein